MFRVQTILRVNEIIRKTFKTIEEAWSRLIPKYATHRIRIINHFCNMLCVSPLEAAEFLWLFEDYPSITQDIWTAALVSLEEMGAGNDAADTCETLGSRDEDGCRCVSD
jgi:hypothetical protein